MHIIDQHGKTYEYGTIIAVTRYSFTTLKIYAHKEVADPFFPIPQYPEYDDNLHPKNSRT